MELSILEIAGENYVKVRYKYGTFLGKWVDKSIPKIGQKFAEVEVSFKIVAHEILNEKKYCIQNIDGKNIICGLILSDHDYYAQYLDFAGDAVIKNDYICGSHILMTDINESNLKNKFVRLEVDEIELYPVDFGSENIIYKDI